MVKGQNIKTNYKPTSPVYTQAQDEGQIVARHRARRELNQRLKREQGGAFGGIKRFGRGLVQNFKENARRPIYAPSPAPKPKGSGKASASGTDPAYPLFHMPPIAGGLDLSRHPDPMVSGMYRQPREEAESKRKKRKDGVTEIHYHYH